MMRPKEQLGILVREVKEVFTVCSASSMLGTSSIETAKTLARWTMVLKKQKIPFAIF